MKKTQKLAWYCKVVWVIHNAVHTLTEHCVFL